MFHIDLAANWLKRGIEGWKTSGPLSVSYFSLTTVHMPRESMDVKGIDWFVGRSEKNN